MRQYLVFFKKEWMESLRSGKAVMMLVVFAIFGVMNPFIAKITPTLVKNLLPKGSQVPIPEPTVYDSWTQFFKNLQQMGLIILVLLFCGILVNELTKGTLVNFLTKGLSKTAILWSKFSIMTLWWTVSVALCFLITFLYNSYYFKGEEVSHLFLAVGSMWLFGIFLLATLLFASTFLPSVSSVLLLTGGVVVLLIILQFFKGVKDYSPLVLITKNMTLLKNELSFNDTLPPILVTFVAIVIFLFSGTKIFQKKEF